VVETNVVRGVFGNRGARLKSWELKKYTDERGKTLDLVPRPLGAETTRPFELRVDKEELTRRLSESLFAARGIGTRVDATKGPVTLVSSSLMPLASTPASRSPLLPIPTW